VRQGHGLTRRAGACAAAVALGLVGACGGSRPSPSIRVSPRSGTFDVPFRIEVAGLHGGQRAVVAFSGRARDGRRVRHAIPVRANGHGRVTLADVYPYAHLDPLEGWPRALTITVSSRGATASAHATRRAVAARAFPTSAERPARVGFYGEWMRPPGTRRHTAILLFGGSEGGLPQGPLAATLVAHGYPVLELAYFAEPGLPQSLERIPLEYFARALRWLAKQPAVDPRRIVTFGISRGGEASLLVASTFPRLVHAAVGYVPSSSIVPSPVDPNVPAWTFHGKPAVGDRTPTSPGRYGWIRVDRISGPVFVAGGGRDDLWASGLSVEDIRARMLLHHRHDVVALDYPRAGHLLGQVVPPQIPVSPVGYGIVQSRYGPLDLGGSPAADEAALESSWPKLLLFLHRLGTRP
jgi:dienelactone hydrolase